MNKRMHKYKTTKTPRRMIYSDIVCIIIPKASFSQIYVHNQLYCRIYHCLQVFTLFVLSIQRTLYNVNKNVTLNWHESKQAHKTL